MKPSHASRATQDRQVMVERSDRMQSTGEGNGKPIPYSCLENPMKSMKRKNDRILKEELPWSVWLPSKSLQTINAGEGVEKRETSYTVSGNAN